MDLFIVEVEFIVGKNIGQVWKYCNLNLFQVLDLHESFTLQILRESNIYIQLISESSKKISIEDFLFNI